MHKPCGDPSKGVTLAYVDQGYTGERAAAAAEARGIELKVVSLHEAYAPLFSKALDEAERQALIAAVAEARADPRPDVPHEDVRTEILAEVEALERRLAAPPAT